MPMTAVLLVMAAVMVWLAGVRPRKEHRVASVSREDGSPPSCVAMPGTPAEDALIWHRRRALEALDRHAAGQPLCGVGAAASGSLKQGEGAVAALTEVTRRHRTQPREGLTTSAAHVLRAWRAERGQRDGPHWHAYRAGGEQAIRNLTADLSHLESQQRP